MDHDAGAGAQLSERIRRRHRIAANGVGTADSTVCAETHLLFGKVGMTDQLPQHFCGFGIAQARKDDLASVVIEDGIGFLDPVSRPELAEILHDRHEQDPAPAP